MSSVNLGRKNIEHHPLVTTLAGIHHRLDLLTDRVKRLESSQYSFGMPKPNYFMSDFGNIGSIGNKPGFSTLTISDFLKPKAKDNDAQTVETLATRLGKFLRAIHKGTNIQKVDWKKTADKGRCNLTADLIEEFNTKSNVDDFYFFIDQSQKAKVEDLACRDIDIKQMLKVLAKRAVEEKPTNLDKFVVNAFTLITGRKLTQKVLAGLSSGDVDLWSSRIEKLLADPKAKPEGIGSILSFDNFIELSPVLTKAALNQAHRLVQVEAMSLETALVRSFMVLQDLYEASIQAGNPVAKAGEDFTSAKNQIQYVRTLLRDFSVAAEEPADEVSPRLVDLNSFFQDKKLREFIRDQRSILISDMAHGLTNLNLNKVSEVVSLGENNEIENDLPRLRDFDGLFIETLQDLYALVSHRALTSGEARDLLTWVQDQSFGPRSERQNIARLVYGVLHLQQKYPDLIKEAPTQLPKILAYLLYNSLEIKLDQSFALDEMRIKNLQEFCQVYQDKVLLS